MKPNPNAPTKFFKESFQLPTILGVTAEAETQRNDLAIAATAIMTVATAEQNEIAIGISRDIQSYIKLTQESGLAFRRKVNDFLGLVKRTEDDHLAPIISEKARVDNLCLGHAQRELQRIETEKRRQAEEYAKAEATRASEAKRLADEQAAREAEARRKQEAIDRKAREATEAAAALAAAAKNKKQREEAEAAYYAAQRKQEAADEAKAKAEAELAAKREADALTAAASEQRVQDVLRRPAPVAVKAAGSSVKKVMRFEVIDAATVYETHSGLCKIEVKPSAVLAVCVAAKGATELAPDITTVPGLKLWWADDLSTRRR